MCTVSWRFELTAEQPAPRFELFFNRDESRRRGPAHPPQIMEPVGESKLLAPIDSDAGGTWLAANEHGLVLALLNLYQARGGSRAGSISRGSLPLEWARAQSVAQVQAAFTSRSLEDFAGFRILAFDPSGACGLGSWHGEGGESSAKATRTDAERAGPSGRRWQVSPAGPVISSGFRLDEVESARRATYAALVDRFDGASSEALKAFHTSTDPEPGPRAVRMTREDARTVSTTHVRVSDSAVEMSYAEVGEVDGDWGSPARQARLPRAKP